MKVDLVRSAVIPLEPYERRIFAAHFNQIPPKIGCLLINVMVVCVCQVACLAAMLLCHSGNTSLCEYPAVPPSSRAIHISLCVPSDRTMERGSDSY